MRKKKGFTIVEQAIIAVPAFAEVEKRLGHQVGLRGQSSSTLNNYIRRIALFVIHFGCLPEQISEDEINEYLVSLARDPRSPSRSSFKHMIYGLRCCSTFCNAALCRLADTKSVVIAAMRCATVTIVVATVIVLNVYQPNKQSGSKN